MPNPDRPSIPTSTATTDAKLTFGTWLKRRRRSLDLTQQELGQHAGCSAATVKKIESDDLKPSKQLAELMANVLKVPTHQRQLFIQFARTGQSDAAFMAAPITDHSTHAATPVTSVQRHDNLPAQLNELLGRAQEMATARRVLGKRHARLLTIIGPPGTGKTRLACEIAADAQTDFTQGVCAVWLGGVVDAVHVPAAIAQALGLHGHGMDSVASVLAYLREKQVLLLLDNFEHVLDAATVVSAVLQSAPGVKIIITSREPLRLYGERELPVSPLELPDVNRLPPPDALAKVASVALFVERVQAVRPEFELSAANSSDVARVCTWLDGLPLAIEMAAAHLKWMTPKLLLQQLSQRLSTLSDNRRDMLPRQQTMQAAIDWSYNRLDDDERMLLRRLAVFPDGCVLDVAESVCSDIGNRPHPTTVDRVLNQLVSKSLVVAESVDGQMHYALLEPVRQYGLDKLTYMHELDEMRSRHAAYFASQIEQGSQTAYGQAQTAWLMRMDAIINDLRAALDWAFDGRTDSSIAVQLVNAASRFWIIHGYFEEGWRYATQARAMCDRMQNAATDAAPHTAQRAWLFCWTAEIAFYRHDFRTSMALAEQAMALAHDCNDDRALASALWVQAVIGRWTHDWHLARTAIEDSIVYSRTVGDIDLLTRSLCSKGDLLEVLGDYDAALDVYRECLTMAMERGDERNLAMTLRGMGDILRSQQRLEEADIVYNQCCELNRALGDRVGLGIVLVNRAIIANLRHGPVAARELALEAQAVFLNIGSLHELPYIHRLLGQAALAEGDVIEAASRFRASLEGNRKETNRTGMLAGVLAFATLAHQMGQAKMATVLHSAVSALINNNADSLLATDRRVFAELDAALQAQLDPSTRRSYAEAGAGLTMEMACNQALQLG